MEYKSKFLCILHDRSSVRSVVVLFIRDLERKAMLKKSLSMLIMISCAVLNVQGGCCPGGSCKPATQEIKKLPAKQDAPSNVKGVIQQAYGKVAEGGGVCELFGGGCCGGGGDLSKYLGYSEEELKSLSDANLGLGCGNPVTLGVIEEGFIVLDLGSGAGFDCFLAARKVGPTGKVIGVDMTKVMIQKARENAHKFGFNNVEFRLGDIEDLPVVSNSVDIVMSNCVINLAPDKSAVFKEVYRVLKPGGKMYVSDVVLLQELAPEQKTDDKLLCACVAGALLKGDYLDVLRNAGFEVVIVGEDREINKKWFGNDLLPIVSLKFIASKK